MRMRAGMMYLLRLTIVLTCLVLIGDSSKNAGADVDCTLPTLTTGPAYVWCIVSNQSGALPIGQSDNASMILTILSYEGATNESSLPIPVTIPAGVAPLAGETAPFAFLGQAVYKGYDNTTSPVVSTTQLSLLPTTGAGFYSARLHIGGVTATTTLTTQNVSVACYQLDAASSARGKRNMFVTCQ